MTLTDFFFKPISVAHILFSTNIGEDGGRNIWLHAFYLINLIEFYNNFATRQLDSYNMRSRSVPGLPMLVVL